MKKRVLANLVMFCCILLITACGQKGPLEQPTSKQQSSDSSDVQ